MRGIFAALTVAVVCCGLRADVVVLHDGRFFQGEVISHPTAPMVQIRTDLGVLQFRPAEVREVRIGKGAEPPARPAPPSATTQAEPTVKLDPAAQALFSEVQQLSDKAATGGEGLAIWQQFLKEHPAGPLAEMARQRLAVWKERADADHIRFGPQWLPRGEVQARNAKADALLRKAESTIVFDEILRLLGQAAQEHPYRPDIPLRKAEIYFKDGKGREFGLALGEAAAIDPDNIVARNNIGVLQARQRQWLLATENLGRAALLSDDERVLDNLDQVCFMAAAAGASPNIVDACDRSLRQVVAQLQQADSRKGQARWGDRWIPQQEYQRYQRENHQISRDVSAIKAKIDNLRAEYARLQTRKQDLEAKFQNNEELHGINRTMRHIEGEVRKLRGEQAGLEAKRHTPPHAGKLIMLTADGKGDLEVVQIGPAAANPPPTPQGRNPQPPAGNPPANDPDNPSGRIFD